MLLLGSNGVVPHISGSAAGERRRGLRRNRKKRKNRRKKKKRRKRKKRRKKRKQKPANAGGKEKGILGKAPPC